MDHLRRLGNSISISIPVDENRFTGRECPRSDCEGYFKIEFGTGLKSDGLPCHCPYCGHSAGHGEFWTKAQIEYARSVAIRKITDAIHKDLKRLEFDHKPKGAFGIGFSMKLKTGRQPPIHYYRERQLETEVVCTNCTLRYSVYGVFAYCPDCGQHNSVQILVLVPVAVDSPRRYTGAMNAIDERACGKPGCDNFGKPGLNIVGHGWFVTKSGRRRRYRCTVCGGTLSTNTGTAYRGLRCSRREFDQVAILRVEGVSISATARVTGHSRTTIARWLERAATAVACFNHRLLRDFDVIELQADELCTFIGSKRRTLWLFATIEVCSRLWAGSVLGRRSHRNTKAAINDVILRGRLVGCPLIATDGFEYYVGVMVRLLGSACVYGQVLKTRRNNRVVRVERRVKIGTASRLNAALLASEDSETLNTSFIERLNLTIRQGSAYLRRRSPCHARGADQLRGHVELLRCYYHFIRPHRALRFGRETRTPAMQAGLVSQRLALRDIFTAGGLTRRIFVAVVHVSVTVQPTESDEAELSTRCSPSARRQAA